MAEIALPRSAWVAGVAAAGSERVLVGVGRVVA